MLMVSMPISSLLDYMRVMADDYDVNLQNYTDKELTDYLRVGIILQEASWNHGYTVVKNVEVPENPYYEIIGDTEPEQWLQILFVLKTAMGMKAFEERFSYDNKVIKITNTDQSQNKKSLKEFYDEILQERKYSCAGFAYNTWDDFFTRSNLILNEITKGYR